MNRSLAYESQTDPSRSQIEEKPAYRVALVCLLLVWVVFSAATVILAVALFVPGHLGLTGLLQALRELLPLEPPVFTTSIRLVTFF